MDLLTADGEYVCVCVWECVCESVWVCVWECVCVCVRVCVYVYVSELFPSLATGEWAVFSEEDQRGGGGG